MGERRRCVRFCSNLMLYAVFGTFRTLSSQGSEKRAQVPYPQGRHLRKLQGPRPRLGLSAKHMAKPKMQMAKLCLEFGQNQIWSHMWKNVFRICTTHIGICSPCTSGANISFRISHIPSPKIDAAFKRVHAFFHPVDDLLTAP